MQPIGDDFVKSPDAAFRCILRRCGVLVVRLTPQAFELAPCLRTFYEVVKS